VQEILTILENLSRDLITHKKNREVPVAVTLFCATTHWPQSGVFSIVKNILWSLNRTISTSNNSFINVGAHIYTYIHILWLEIVSYYHNFFQRWQFFGVPSTTGMCLRNTHTSIVFIIIYTIIFLYLHMYSIFMTFQCLVGVFSLIPYIK
jgi:hypothetical protein